MTDTAVRSPVASDAPPRGAPGSARRARQVAALALWSVLRRIVMTSAGLRAVNHLHRRLSPAARRRFYYLCFDEACPVEGPWTVDFAGRSLILPLHRDFGLAWVFAIGFDGYDPEIHQFYESVVRGARPPRVFFDVGASYGLHSLRLLAHGARVVAFEPNPACHPFFRECCERNGFAAELHAVAVGARAEVAELAVPGHQTYLGTIVSSVKAGWQDRGDVTTRLVPQVTLDAFAEDNAVLPDLIKIDAEGSELAVLQGARRVLERARPLVVLESWPAPDQRTALFRLLASDDYRLQALPCPPESRTSLTLSEFLGSPAVNFLASPAAPAETDYLSTARDYRAGPRRCRVSGR
jgi:FkbM family methyltransferase